MFQPYNDQVTVHRRTYMSCRDKDIVRPSICGRDKTVPIPMYAEAAHDQVDLSRQGETAPLQLHERAFFHQRFQGFTENLAFAGAQVEGFLDLPEAQGAAGMLLQQGQDVTKVKITHIV